jgi:Uma2 family endonuclease
MGATTRVSFEDFCRLQDRADDGVRYELDDGELIVTPSPTPRHNLVSFKLRRALSSFVHKYSLGVVTGEVDFRLSPSVVRKPDVAFVAANRMTNFDLDHTPIETAPTLAVEVISESNLAQDTAKKVRQYLNAGSQAVWLVYPALRLVEIHSREEKRDATEPAHLTEKRLFGGRNFALSLTELFDENPEI